MTKELTAQQARIALAEGKVVKGADDFSYRWPKHKAIECGHCGEWNFDKETYWGGPHPDAEPYTIVEPEPEKPKPKRLIDIEEMLNCEELTVIYYSTAGTVIQHCNIHTLWFSKLAEIINKVAATPRPKWAVYEGYWTREEIENV